MTIDATFRIPAAARTIRPCWLLLLAGFSGAMAQDGPPVSETDPRVIAAEAEAEAKEPPPGAFERSPIHWVLEEERALSAHEPMYFVVGAADDEAGDVTARFQLSFKYRIFDPDSAIARHLPPTSALYFSYSQVSLWNLSADSAPFEDTNYRPSFFWQELGSGHGIWPDFWRFGFEHSSNGQDEEDSRSINTLFVRPAWWTEIGGRELVFSPKIYAYVEKADNPDIYRYRGHVDWQIRYGSEASWLIDANFRRSEEGNGSVELNLSYPIRQPIFYRAGGFIYLQYFQGYGESLLGYNVDKEPTLRLGFAIVR